MSKLKYFQRMSALKEARKDGSKWAVIGAEPDTWLYHPSKLKKINDHTLKVEDWQWIALGYDDPKDYGIDMPDPMLDR